jgi:hypothetical protein
VRWRLPFTTISQSEQSAVEEARQVVVRTPEEWKVLWKEHAPNQPMPAVDFTKSMVIGVFLGSRNTAGYRVTITGIERDGANIVVTPREERPGTRHPGAGDHAAASSRAHRAHRRSGDVRACGTLVSGESFVAALPGGASGQAGGSSLIHDSLPDTGARHRSPAGA